MAIINKTNWSVISDGNPAYPLSFGENREKHNILPGETFALRIEDGYFFDNYFKEEFKGRKLGMTVQIVSIQYNKSLLNQICSFFLQGTDLKKLLASKIGINDFLSVHYKGCPFIRGGMRKHLMVIQGMADPKGQSKPFVDPGPTSEEQLKRERFNVGGTPQQQQQAMAQSMLPQQQNFPPQQQQQQNFPPQQQQNLPPQQQQNPLANTNTAPAPAMAENKNFPPATQTTTPPQTGAVDEGWPAGLPRPPAEEEATNAPPVNNDPTTAASAYPTPF